MKSFVVVAFAVAGITSVCAQSLAGLPTCAYTCVGNGIPASCNLNPACICNSTSFIESVTCCVATACDAADQAATIKYAQGICIPAGVTNLPTAATCAAAATGSAAGNSSASSGQSASPSTTSSASLSSALASAETSASLTATGGSSASSASAKASSTSNMAKPLLMQGAGMVGVIVVGAVALM